MAVNRQPQSKFDFDFHTKQWRGPAAIVNNTPILSLERMLHKDFESKYSVEIIAGRESQGTCRQN
jgi:hypothetical protein